MAVFGNIPQMVYPLRNFGPVLQILYRFLTLSKGMHIAHCAGHTILYSVHNSAVLEVFVLYVGGAWNFRDPTPAATAYLSAKRCAMLVLNLVTRLRHLYLVRLGKIEARVTSF